MTEKKQKSALSEKSYTKEQLKKSRKYREMADVLAVILKDERQYTDAQTSEMVKKYLKIEVK